MANKQPETLAVEDIEKTLKEQFPGILIWKIHGGPMQMTGIPDLLCFYEGRTYALEVKCQRSNESPLTARSRLTPRQKLVLEQLRNAGIMADCILSSAEAIGVVGGGHVFLEDTGRPALELPPINSRS